MLLPLQVSMENLSGNNKEYIVKTKKYLQNLIVSV